MAPKPSIIRLGQNPQPENQSQSNSKQVGKFVLIRGDDELHFIYGPIDEFPYHAGLVRQFCEMREIPSGWVKKPDLYEIYDTSLEIDGGGWIELDSADKRINLYGYSTAYGGFDGKDILYLLQSHADFEGYRFDIE